MLGTFPKDFPKCQLPKCAISQAATSQVCSSRGALPPAHPILVARPQPIIAAALGPIAAFGASKSLNNLWEVAT